MNKLTVIDYSLLEYLFDQPLSNLHSTLLIIPNEATRHNICKETIQKGNLKVLQILKNNDLLSIDTCDIAIECGQVDVLEWALQNECKLNLKSCKFSYAAKCGHLNILKWSHKNGYLNDPWIASSAAEGGHLNIIQWFISVYGKIHESVFIQAILCGHLHIIKWAIKSGYNMNKTDKKFCAYAAGEGHLDILQLLRENGYVWGRTTCINAVVNGHLHIIEWVYKNGCPWDKNCFSEAVCHGHLHIIWWILMNKLYNPDKEILDILNSNYKVFQYKILPLLLKNPSYVYYKFFCPFMPKCKHKLLQKGMFRIKTKLFSCTSGELDSNIQSIVLNYL
jgi:hypothetical protein